MGAEFDAILNLPCTKANDHKSIRELTDSLREHTYNLQALGFDLEAGRQMTVMIFKKLD
jgi:hypothetical protein